MHGFLSWSMPTRCPQQSPSVTLPLERPACFLLSVQTELPLWTWCITEARPACFSNKYEGCLELVFCNFGKFLIFQTTESIL